jgi:haloalkane dehalogenase
MAFVATLNRNMAKPPRDRILSAQHPESKDLYLIRIASSGVAFRPHGIRDRRSLYFREGWATLSDMNGVSSERLPYPSRELQVGSHTLRFLDEGSGEDVLLCVHGNPTWSFYWRGVIEQFSASQRVIAVDHIGCGRSDKPSRGEFDYTLAAHRDNLVALIDDLDLRRITLVAHDWGGAIGLTSLLERQDRFNRIVLLNTGAFPPPFVPWRIAACRLPILGTAAVRGLNAFAKAAITMAMSRQRMAPDVARGLLAPYDSWQNRVAIDAFVRDIPMSKRHPTYATLAQLEADLPALAGIPSLLVWGMKDWCFRPECLRRFQSVWPEAETLEIADAGHYVIEDAPQETLGAMAEFFQRTRQADQLPQGAGDA